MSTSIERTKHVGGTEGYLRSIIALEITLIALTVIVLKKLISLLHLCTRYGHAKELYYKEIKSFNQNGFKMVRN